jgi:Transcriptional regulators of sugar metabolism
MSEDILRPAGAIPDGIGAAQSMRWERLLALLADRGRLAVAEASRELGVSESTIRRDFDLMHNAQLAKRTHGGIVASSIAYSLPLRYGRMDPDIFGIGEAAAAYVLDKYSANPTVGINGGTTATAVAEHLGRLIDPAPNGPADEVRLTVVASALNIANTLVLRPQIRIVSLGGVVRSRSYELTGPIATESMNGLWLDCMILGFVGLDAIAGATCEDTDEAAVTRTMVEHAGTVIAVGASKKIGERSFAKICSLRDIDVLITDKGIGNEEKSMLAATNINVITV